MACPAPASLPKRSAMVPATTCGEGGDERSAPTCNNHNIIEATYRQHCKGQLVGKDG